MIIGKIFRFEAAHQLPGEKTYGECANMHGHSYKLIVELEGEPDKTGMVMNFKKLKKIVNKSIIKIYDHSVLNEKFKIPTAELMVEELKNQLTALLPNGIIVYSLTLYETEDSYAKFVCR